MWHKFHEWRRSEFNYSDGFNVKLDAITAFRAVWLGGDEYGAAIAVMGMGAEVVVTETCAEIKELIQSRRSRP